MVHQKAEAEDEKIREPDPHREKLIERHLPLFMHNQHRCQAKGNHHKKDIKELEQTNRIPLVFDHGVSPEVLMHRPRARPGLRRGELHSSISRHGRIQRGSGVEPISWQNSCASVRAAGAYSLSVYGGRTVPAQFDASHCVQNPYSNRANALNLRTKNPLESANTLPMRPLEENNFRSSELGVSGTGFSRLIGQSSAMPNDRDHLFLNMYRRSPRQRRFGLPFSPRGRIGNSAAMDS